MSMNPQDIQELRAKAETVINRAKSDPAFREQLKADPTATFEAAGIPSDAAQELAQESGGEVRGYAMCLATCWFTECAITRL
ncbi:MAG TPA: hypothetical protein VNL35_01685 [Chloroflexota bacterium]|nr:hypothetical protein [Chloroflexota bacterium]